MLDNEIIQPFRRRNFSNRVKRRYNSYKAHPTIAPGNLSTKRKQLKVQQQKKTEDPITLRLKTFLSCKVDNAPKQEATVPVILPRHLHRPESKQADVTVPDLDVPSAFVRDSLGTYGVTLFRALAQTRTIVDSSAARALPPSVAITIPDSYSEDRPTHVLAAYAPNCQNVTLFPVHSIVLAAHCHNFPPLATPTEPLPPNHLPVQPFCIPHVQSYAALSQYLYTHRQDLLFASLCAPLPPPKFFPTTPHSTSSPLPSISKDDMLKFARELSETYTEHKLLQSISSIHFLWKDVYALQILDEGLWEILDVAWGVYICAVACKTGVSTDALHELLPSFDSEESTASDISF